MTKIVEITVEIAKHHGINCPFKMAVPCKKKPTMSGCLMDGTCCPWIKINWPEEWLRCERFVEFCERMLPGGKEDALTDAYRNGYTDGQIVGNDEGRRNMLNEIYQHVKDYCDPMTEDYLQSLRGAP